MDESCAANPDKPLVSVVTVCLNAVDTIAATFDSILSQTYPHVEMVVIDGGSTDGTLEVIKRYADRIAYWSSGSDTGIYDAMNKGIRAAKGEVLYFLNANDTLYANDVLANVMRAFVAYPDVRMVYGDIALVAADRSKTRIKNQWPVPDKTFFYNHTIFHQAIFYRRSVFAEIGLYNEKYKIVSDWEFNLRALCESRKPAGYLPLVIANFLEGGMSGGAGMRKLHSHERDLVHWEFFPEWHVRLIMTLELCGRKYFNSLYKHFVKTKMHDRVLAKYRRENRLDNIVALPL